jgi:hypothetical protein
MVNNKNKIIVKDQWDERYLRESLWMPFGSLMNSYAQANQQKGISLEEFVKVARKAFELASEFTEEAFKKIEREPKKEVELPLKKE